MIDQTQSFKKIKIEQQRIWDFALLICHAVPALKKTIKGVEESVPNYSLPNPDYFTKPDNKDRLKAIASHYNYNLGKYVLLSSFSFFESYFRSVVQELIDFHGGKDEFIKDIRDSYNKFFSYQNNLIAEHKKKLQEPISTSREQLYRKHSDFLSKDSKFRFPCELFALYGLKSFIDDVLGDNFKSVMIPSVLEFAFHLNLSEKINTHQDLIDMDLAQTFESVRKIRNDIAHGDDPEIGLKKVVAYSDFLKKFTLKIDKHLITHYFIIEKYV